MEQSCKPTYLGSCGKTTRSLSCTGSLMSFCFKTKSERQAGKMSQWVEVLATRPAALSLTLGACMVKGGGWLPRLSSGLTSMPQNISVSQSINISIDKKWSGVLLNGLPTIQETLGSYVCVRAVRAPNTLYIDQRVHVCLGKTNVRTTLLEKLSYFQFWDQLERGQSL